MQSPTQSARFVPYSPTSKPNNYTYDSYQPPPQTPPSFPQATSAQSPRFGHPGADSSPSALMNGNGHQHSATNAQYPMNPTSPIQQHSRTMSNSMAGSNGYSSYGSNIPSSHAHPSSRQGSLAISPKQEYNSAINNQMLNGINMGDMGNIAQPVKPSSQERPVRANDPMSFASILSEPATRAIPAPNKIPLASKSSQITTVDSSSMKAAIVKMEIEQTTPPAMSPALAATKPVRDGADKTIAAPILKPLAKPRKSLTAKENEDISRAMEAIESKPLSDVEGSEFASEKERYGQKCRKRALELEEVENSKRKRRRTHLLDQLLRSFAMRNSGASERFRAKYEAAAQNEIHEKEIQEEKERKKDMQRKRRRENTVRAEKLKLAEAEEKANRTEDVVEKERLLREIEKSQKKINHTQSVMERGTAPDEISEVTPLAPNYEGGTTSSFHLAAQASPEPPKKKARPSGPVTRPKKSKEKKQAEKDAAEAAYAAMEREELVRIAPKQDPRKESIKKEAKASRSKEMTPISPVTNYESKGYQQIYEQIWRDLARKDIPRVYRIKVNSLSTRQENLRKTAQLAGKQAKKWQERTNKSLKDTQARAKRTMREMMSFWKRNEREERDLRRMAEKKEIEDAKKAEADREANRQKRKLNFLISQTELYSHFIGRKIKTDEVERATDDPEVAASGEKVQASKDDAPTVDLPDSVADLRTKVTNFEDLDFDAEDDAALKEAAIANAQSAIQEAQDKARAFNGDNQMAAFDDTELNFQNPTSLGDVQVSQPDMLQAQLKEYQLKGLNWLVNLYEQGINGILADEMGLGKTVQSISVMGYLAEHHNIWGPFLVIAPSSTLHNWQQEIARFVPSIKVLPYWGSAKDRKVLRKFWDRKHITYSRDSEFHVLVTSYQLVVQDAQYFQKIRWQYMILDEAQAIKSSNSSRWKVLLGFHCRNRLLLTGTPIQNNMQELWALLHFIMPTLFDSHDEFSDWFSKDIESHAQSNTKLNQDQLRRLHMILKPFMLRRVKSHVQKELGNKVEKDIFCDLTYRQRAYYSNLRSRISIMDLIEKATLGDDQDTATLMNLVMQFRKVCNHPDLFERAETSSPFSLSYFAETASFLREGQFVNLGYSIRSMIEYDLPRLLCSPAGRLAVAGPENPRAGFETKYLGHLMSIWDPQHIVASCQNAGGFSFLQFVDTSYSQASRCARLGFLERAVELKGRARRHHFMSSLIYEGDEETPKASHHMFNIVGGPDRPPLTEIQHDGYLGSLMNISSQVFEQDGFAKMEPAARPGACAPPIQISCSDQSSITERQQSLFHVPTRQALFSLPTQVEEAILENDVEPSAIPPHDMLPAPALEKARYTNISVPSMRRFVTDSGKLAKLDHLLAQLKNGGHRVLLYFQMTRMIDLMEEYLTYRNYRYCRLDGSTKLEDRRDTVHDFQTRPDIFIFLLSTRAGGLGINLTSADTVIFYDSDWNPTIDSQAMDRAHRLGQTKQVTVYRMITRGTIEERIRKRALQKEEVQRVVISGGASGGVDFNTRHRENRTKDIALWLADDDQAALIEQKEKEAAEKPEEETKGKKGKRVTVSGKRKRGEVSLDDMYHEGEGHFEDASAKPSGAATPVSAVEVPAPGAKKKGPRGGRGVSKKAKTVQERLRVIDADGDLGMGGI
ncbi:putative DNA helicase ino80 [Endocarpon pusillum]|uniref:Chromatin-remodeling ATPase INO80 n=1 Tax=Endocarpon pusillum TaxID=364733 RepID=A0A8H7AQ53_9EURO|nr:putative DNA helicase ino80 [Endocarpon pusillum]